MSRVASRGRDVPVPPPSVFHWATSKPDNLGNDPGADGEIGAVQAEGEKGGGHGDHKGGDTGEQDRGHRVKPQRITAPNSA